MDAAGPLGVVIVMALALFGVAVQWAFLFFLTQPGPMGEAAGRTAGVGPASVPAPTEWKKAA